MSFRVWLRLQRRRQDPVGDLARDVLADPALKGRRLSGLGAYLMDLGVEPKVLEALVRARLEWGKTRCSAAG